LISVRNVYGRYVMLCAFWNLTPCSLIDTYRRCGLTADSLLCAQSSVISRFMNTLLCVARNLTCLPCAILRFMSAVCLLFSHLPPSLLNLPYHSKQMTANTGSGFCLRERAVFLSALPEHLLYCAA